MVFSIVSAVALGVAGVYMLLSGKYAVTRRMALIPLAMAAMEIAMCGVLDWGMFPVLTAVLVACRLTVLVCCNRVLKRMRPWSVTVAAVVRCGVASPRPPRRSA